MCSKDSINWFKLSLICGTEENAILFCKQKQLLPSQAQCPSCECTLNKMYTVKHLGRKTQYRFQCNSKSCKESGKNQVPLKRNTIFANSKMEVRQMLFLMYCYIDNKSYDSVIREVNFFTSEHILSRNTISHYYSLFREICTLAVEAQEAKNKIGGVGFTVEIDESKFGRRKYNKGRIVTGTWVLGGICVESGELFLQPVDKRDKATLLPIIIDKVHPGTTIITDCWRAYTDLANNGFSHLTVNHSLNFVG